jgi:hypothetical protein
MTNTDDQSPTLPMQKSPFAPLEDSKTPTQENNQGPDLDDLLTSDEPDTFGATAEELASRPGIFLDSVEDRNLPDPDVHTDKQHLGCAEPESVAPRPLIPRPSTPSRINVPPSPVSVPPRQRIDQQPQSAPSGSATRIGGGTGREDMAYLTATPIPPVGIQGATQGPRAMKSSVTRELSVILDEVPFPYISQKNLGAYGIIMRNDPRFHRHGAVQLGVQVRFSENLDVLYVGKEKDLSRLPLSIDTEIRLITLGIIKPSDKKAVLFDYQSVGDNARQEAITDCRDYLLQLTKGGPLPDPKSMKLYMMSQVLYHELKKAIFSHGFTFDSPAGTK